MDKLSCRRSKPQKREVGQVTGAMCAVSGVLLIAPLLPIIYERWERFYLLDQQAKLISAAVKRKKEIQEKIEEKAEVVVDGKGEEKRKDKSPILAPKDEKAKVETERSAEDLTDRRPRNKKVLARQKSFTVAEAGDGVEEFTKPEFNIKKEDDVVWAHIRTASLKRMQSQTSFKGLPKQRSMSDSISEQHEPAEKTIEVEVNHKNGSIHDDDVFEEGESSAKKEYGTPSLDRDTGSSDRAECSNSVPE